MRIMALDIGDVRTGIAISDPAGHVASPIAVLPTNEVLANARSFQQIVQDWEPELMVCGLPKSLDGNEGAQAVRIRKAACDISASCGIPHEFVDERLSSREAKQRLREMGYDERKMRGKVDMIAASIFLQTYLDARSSASLSTTQPLEE